MVISVRRSIRIDEAGVGTSAADRTHAILLRLGGDRGEIEGKIGARFKGGRAELRGEIARDRDRACLSAILMGTSRGAATHSAAAPPAAIIPPVGCASSVFRGRPSLPPSPMPHARGRLYQVQSGEVGVGAQVVRREGR